MQNRESSRGNNLQTACIPALISAFGGLVLICLCALLASSLILGQIISEDTIPALTLGFCCFSAFLAGQFAIKKGHGISPWIMTMLSFICLSLLIILGGVVMYKGISFEGSNLWLVCSLMVGYLLSIGLTGKAKPKRKKKR